MKKGILAILVVLLISLPSALCLAEEESETEEIFSSGEWDYYINDDGTATISGWAGDDVEVVIPEEIDGIQVTQIGNDAFVLCDSLTTITIPESVTQIGDSAFAYCGSLTDITIPASVTQIGDWAFAYCSSLTDITIPESVTQIGDSAFAFCSSLILIVERDSYAVQYAKDNGILYEYTDANDWLNS